jgi:hypothetical protein
MTLDEYSNLQPSLGASIYPQPLTMPCLGSNPALLLAFAVDKVNAANDRIVEAMQLCRNPGL